MFIVPLSSLQQMTKLETTSAIPQGKSSFSQIFEEVLKNAKETQAISNEDSVKLALGQVDNLSEVMINSAKASTAMQMTVELTSRAVSSYKEIMQMQV
ncbi:MAG: flagellar hook-basal body complex protein FliE [Oscillospiraceae bacterium]